MRASMSFSLPLLCLVVGLMACATPPPSARPTTSTHATTEPHAASRVPAAHSAVRTALSMLGRPYRYGGTGPSGFDCSGLVVYSYGKAGLSGLPRTAAGLEGVARPVALEQLRPGDLLFFRLSGPKTQHVGMYVGDREFVHAPSSGGRVERVGFDHVYWGPRIRRAGRIAH